MNSIAFSLILVGIAGMAICFSIGWFYHKKLEQNVPEKMEDESMDYED